MSDTAAPGHDPDQLPKHTTPTWEVELLISGVAVFAMLQLPGWLDDQLFALLPRLSTDFAGVVLPLYIYLKTAAVILAVTFALHLLLRANWIALVGMHSVYPDGVLWENLRMGPVQREIDRHRHGSTGDSIERADNRATVVFAIGVMLATRLLIISLMVAVVFAVIMTGLSLTGLHADMFLVFSLCVVTLIVLLFGAHEIDRRFGARLREGGAVQRGLAAIFRYSGLFGISYRSEVMSLLASHSNERRINRLILVVFAVLFGAVTFGLNSMKKPLQAGSYGLFPRSVDDSRTLRSNYYDDQRDPLHDPMTPFVQSAVIEGSYLRLTVPYQPQRDAPAMQSHCARALMLPHGDARGDALLECMARLRAVSLDGTPLATLHYDVGSDSRTRRPALQAMIDVRSLASGRHVLRVEHAPGNDDASEGNHADVIAFWR
ncbi:hypothetical protein [Rhodanobacter sp. C03]|uniref:hypothetical protein n=1 Tax=Rhodanobacter sp. C03 TaxID=1945858 RepID=UPI000987129E|nr:hypothetical protein [Rhodanobacter sp. C03]OOG59561.1 hypothetical protein B0E48_01740 [Rhodanobacter sp. C03]